MTARHEPSCEVPQMWHRGAGCVAKRMAFVLSLLGVLCLCRSVEAKAPRTVELSESDVATVKTALGYTTLLNFDGRPTSVVLGDQDAFKAEYVGNGLAIKPLHGQAKTNLFVFTDYDRFNFRLVSGPTAEADYLLKIRRNSSTGYPIGSKVEPEETTSTALIKKSVNRKAGCGGVTLGVHAIAWPSSKSTLLVQFRAEATPSLVKKGELRFQPGDFEVWQDRRSLPIESLHLDRLVLTSAHRLVEGTLVLRQSAMRKSRWLALAFVPDFLKSKQVGCPEVSFSRLGGT